MWSIYRFENCSTILDMVTFVLLQKKKNSGVGTMPNFYLSFNHVPVPGNISKLDNTLNCNFLMVNMKF